MYRLITPICSLAWSSTEWRSIRSWMSSTFSRTRHSRWGRWGGILGRFCCSPIALLTLHITQGTAKATKYTLLHESSGRLNSDQVQHMTFALCHLHEVRRKGMKGFDHTSKHICIFDRINTKLFYLLILACRLSTRRRPSPLPSTSLKSRRSVPSTSTTTWSEQGLECEFSD